jgi:hypothetical protein
VISNPFNASSLTPSLVAAATVDTGFGIFVAACVVDDADGPPVGAASDAPHADNNMEMMNKSEVIFFISCVPSLRGGRFPDEAIPLLYGLLRAKEHCPRNTCATRDLLSKSCWCDDV